ncbi:MAG: NAD(P)/FAD-dependent oxidoreductase [Pseudolabrys sp.]|nr:NAD(P)/FAD-dependent oxidoreductase [Pseudolabrys sp.]
MRNPEVIIIGGGQAGLAMSRSLTAQGIEHLVLERGRIGERWFSERWHSLHLLSTNAQSALPGLPHAGDPDSFMPAQSFGSYLQLYAETIDTPVISGVEVTQVERCGSGYRVSTNAGRWHARAVVIATGACDTPHRPAMAAALAPNILQLSPSQYRTPAQLPPGGVLVVGAASTGLQLAEEIQASGRPVTLAVGDHTRAPRRYRGGDIFDKLEMAGVLDDLASEAGNIEAARRSPSLQLVGRADNRSLNLGTLSRTGVRLAGRLRAIDGAKVSFAGDLAETTAASHRRLLRMLDRIDDAIDANGIAVPAADPEARRPVLTSGDALQLDLRREGIGTVVWATGYTQRYPWLKVPVLASSGEIIHDGGVTASPGLYVLGLVFQRRRRSSFINGCAVDADDLSLLVRRHLELSSRQVA